MAVLAVAGVNALIAAPAHQATLPEYSAFDRALLDSSALSLADGALANDSNPLGEFTSDTDDFAGFVLVEKASFVGSTVPASNIRSENGLLTYRVVSGDTLSTIASKFGISVSTIVWANHLNNSKLLRPGQEIVILPVSGVLHEVRSGENIDSIAELYKVSPRDIRTYNKGAITEGDTVIVPNVKPIKLPAASSLPDIGDYLAFPVRDGHNWGKLHMSAVDISGACGTPVYASAEGMVEEVGSPSSWNNGYGGYIKIKHPLGSVETLYAHNSKNLVSVGDYVNRGDEIAKIGNTGLVQGPTGCHVHFAVYGAKHPFAK